MRHFFVAGCPRSGTTAMQKLLNMDARIVCGMERFKRIKSCLKPEHLEAANFFKPTEDQTNILAPEYYANLLEKWKRGSVLLIGDKTPNFYHEYRYLAGTFPDATFIVLVRTCPRRQAWIPCRSQ